MKQSTYLIQPECKAWKQAIQLHGTGEIMKLHQILQLGLVGLGFVLALPAQAALPTGTEFSVDVLANALVLAKRDDGEGKYESRRDQEEPRANAKGAKNRHAREAERAPAPQDYGYGYERRQQPLLPREDSGRGRQ